MKIKVTQKAFYSGHLLNPEDEIEFEGGKLPSWAEPVNTKIIQTQTPDEQKQEEQTALKNDTFLGRIFNK